MDKTERLGTEKISSLLFKLAIPSIIAQIVNLVYNMVDRIYIGRTEDSVLAMAALAVSIPIITIVAGFTNLFGAGGAPLVSIKLGGNDRNGAEKVLRTAFVLLMCSAVFLTIAINLFLEPLLYAFGADAQNIELAKGYVSIYSYGTIFTHITLGLNPYINAQGRANFGMMTVIIGAVLNIILDPIFIFVFDMGVQGAALATILSQGVSAIWVLCFFFRGKSKLKIKLKNISMERATVCQILALGSSPFIMFITESFVQIAFNGRLLAYGGSIAVGSMAILISIYQSSNMVLQGLSYGAQPIISYNYGAKKYDRVRAIIRLFFFISIGFSMLSMGFVQLFPEFVISVFINDINTIRLASWAIRPFLLGGLTFGVLLACQFCFLAMGQAKISLIIACVRKIFLLIPLIFILPVAIGDSEFAGSMAQPVADLVLDAGRVFSVFLAESVADVSVAVCAAILFALFYRKNLSKDKIEKNGSLL